MTATENRDRQIRADVYRIARTYLEIERGLRPPEHLERFLTPAEYQRQRKQPLDARMRTGEAVLPTDVGRIRLDRNVVGQITATAPTRETDDRWGALVLHFARNHTGRWHLDQLERLTRPSVARAPERQHAGEPDLGERIRRVEEERRIAQGAHRAVTTRLRELRARSTPLSPTEQERAGQLRDQQRTWKRIRGDLDAELDQLGEKARLREQLATIDVRREPHHTELTEQQLEQLLGPAPASERQRGLRDGVIEEIHTYRRRWNITDQRSVLGAAPTDPEHEHDRAELVRTLRAAARALQPEPSGTGRTVGDGADGAGRQQAHDVDLAAER